MKTVVYELCDYTNLHYINIYMKQGVMVSESITIIDCESDTELHVDTVRMSFGGNKILAILKFKDTNTIRYYDIIRMKVE